VEARAPCEHHRRVRPHSAAAEPLLGVGSPPQQLAAVRLRCAEPTRCTLALRRPATCVQRGSRSRASRSEWCVRCAAGLASWAAPCVARLSARLRDAAAALMRLPAPLQERTAALPTVGNPDTGLSVAVNETLRLCVARLSVNRFLSSRPRRPRAALTRPAPRAAPGPALPTAASLQRARWWCLCAAASPPVALRPLRCPSRCPSRRCCSWRSAPCAPRASSPRGSPASTARARQAKC
jgi:hypothetical protein